jgi:penicillin-binding protein 2
VVQVLVISLFATLASRLWYLQVMVGKDFVQQAAEQHYQDIITPAPRGRILDAQGRELVKNESTYVVTVTRSELPKDDKDEAAMLDKLAGVLKMPARELAGMMAPCSKDNPPPCWNGSPYQPVPVKSGVSPAVAYSIEEHAEDYPGIDAMLQPVRRYPYAELGSHMLGYIQPITTDDLAKDAYKDAGYRATDLVGRAGLEMYYDKYLRGASGKQTVEINAKGTVTRVVDTIDPAPGSDVVLSLDANVQKLTEDALERAILDVRKKVDKCEDCPTKGTHFKAPTGAAVVLEASTGRVAAMASYPTYDPSLFIGSISQKDYSRLTAEESHVPLLSRAFQGQYAPGSTFKHVTTSAAVESGRPLNGTFDCPGRTKVGDRWMRNFEGRGEPDPLDWRMTLVKSCDTVYYEIAEADFYVDERKVRNGARPNEHMQRMAAEFGFGNETGIDLPSEADGSIPTRATKRRLWESLRDTYCTDAKTFPAGSYNRRLYTELCTDGYLFRPGDQANLAVGQGDVLATPLQLAVSYAALVNGGNLMEPRIAKAIISPGGKSVTEIKPKVRSKIKVRAEILAYIKDALADVPTLGTSRCAFGIATKPGACGPAFPFDKLSIGGKTGTAQVQGKHDTSWYVSFAPVDKPRYVVVVMVEQAGTGGSVAAPAVREIFSGIYGLEGKPEALADGALPVKLPTVCADGVVKRPGGKCPAAARPAKPTPPPSRSTAPKTTRSPSGTSPSGTARPKALARYADRAERRRTGMLS